MLMQNLRYGLRQLLRTPVFTVVAILTLALGIGANTAIFSVMNAVLLRYMPVRDPHRLVYLNITRTPNRSSQTGHGGASLSEPVFEQFRQEKQTLAEIMAYVPLGIGKVAVRYGKEPEEAEAQMVSGEFFPGLGVHAARGRVLTMDDETSRAPVTVLSYDWWTKRFARNPSVIGQPLYVKDVPFTIVGVAAPDFVGVDQGPTDLWIPFLDSPALRPWGQSDGLYNSPQWWFLMMIGRLAPGVSERQALARLNPVLARTAHAGQDQPDQKEELPKLVFKPAQGISGAREAYDTPLKVLMAMVLLVLAIACANVSLLLVARNAARQREFAMRMALGGSRAQLFRQLLTESLLLVAAGAGLGWLFSLWATRALSAWSGLEVNLSPDRAVLLFTLAASLVAALIFGVAPLGSVLRSPIGLVLKTSAATAHRDRRKLRSSQAVVALQMSLCLVLLVSAGLLVRTLRNLETLNLGMRTSGLLVFGVSPLQRVHSDAESIRFFQGLLARLRVLPGVESVTLMQNRIGSGWSNNTGANVDGEEPKVSGSTTMRWNSVGPDYFHTLGTPILLGRDFNDADSPAGPRVVIVNQTFANRYLADRAPLGHQVWLSNQATGKYTIVGVAADAKYTEVRERPVPMAYFPYTQIEDIASLHVEVRTAGDPAAWMSAVRRAVNEYAPGLAMLQPMTQQAQFDRSFSQERLVFRLSMFFGLLAALLVATGLYGTLAYTVSRRTSEVGLRMALGAQRSQVLWMVLRGSLAVSLAGIVIGLPLAIASTRVVRTMLFGVEPGDPLTFLAALGGIALVAFAASLIPAMRAASVDPIVALRDE
jgi:predicted permease